MGKKKSIGLGFRGTILTIYTFIGFMFYSVFNNFPQNILGGAYEGMYGWNSAFVSTAFTIGSVLAVVIQLIFNRRIANGRHVKAISIGFAVASMVFALPMMLVTNQVVWSICFILFLMASSTWSVAVNGVLVGQWFPRRKGTVMGIATIAFPVVSGLFLSLFAQLFGKYGTFVAFLPFFIVGVIGLILCIIFLKDYPEQCGAYRDNDKNMTPEEAQKLMEMEAEAKKNSVWTYKNTYKSRDFWFMALADGFQLFASVGIMVQVIPILLQIDPAFYAQYGVIALLCITILSCVGSWLLGVIDTNVGTKQAMLISSILMLLSGILGFIGTLTCVLISCAFLAIFMGASSNFFVSAPAEFWPGKDFPSVLSATTPVVNIIQAFGPMVIAIICTTLGFKMSFGLVAILGIAAIILVLLINQEHIKAVGEKYEKRKAEQQ